MVNASEAAAKEEWVATVTQLLLGIEQALSADSSGNILRDASAATGLTRLTNNLIQVTPAPPVLPAQQGGCPMSPASPATALPGGPFLKRKYECASPSLHPSHSLQVPAPEHTGPPASLSTLSLAFVAASGPSACCLSSVPAPALSGDRAHHSHSPGNLLSRALCLSPPSPATPLQPSAVSIAAAMLTHGSRVACLWLSSP